MRAKLDKCLPWNIWARSLLEYVSFVSGGGKAGGSNNHLQGYALLEVDLDFMQQMYVKSGKMAYDALFQYRLVTGSVL